METNRPFAVFDIDGTLIRWQLYHAVVNELAKQGHLGEGAHERIHQARMIWKRREDHEAYRAYEKVIIKAYEEAIGHLTYSQFKAAGDKVLDVYKGQVYTYTRDLIADLKQKGYLLLAISGSHHELVELLAQYYGFDDWVGSQYHRDGERFTGEKYIASDDKATALKQFVLQYKLTYKHSVAVGDTKGDIPMLELVEHPVAFNPEKRLFNHAKRKGWNIVIERKNVVYELVKRDDYYALQ